MDGRHGREGRTAAGRRAVAGGMKAMGLSRSEGNRQEARQAEAMRRGRQSGRQAQATGMRGQRQRKVSARCANGMPHMMAAAAWQRRYGCDGRHNPALQAGRKGRQAGSGRQAGGGRQQVAE